ncbi:MAG: helix-turn-helix domain-containing protein [Microscillaceae bacterium]|nr:helix-turn-helix domain-containing protein [Microscillaceae bacterium]
MKFLFSGWGTGRQAKVSQSNSEDNTIFGFIFNQLEVFLLIGMGLMIYALFNTFTEYISAEAVFISAPDRLTFARTLIFGLMGVEVLLALATSYFRRRSEWLKSILVTGVAFVITYYNHLTISEIFAEIPGSSHAVEVKLLLANWLIFGLGEIASLLMNSKGLDAQAAHQSQVPDWFQSFAQDLQASLQPKPRFSPAPQGFGGKAETPSTQTEIGFHASLKENREEKERKIARRGPSLDYEKMALLVDQGWRTKDIAAAMGCSEASVRKVKNQKKKHHKS